MNEEKIYAMVIEKIKEKLEHKPVRAGDCIYSYYALMYFLGGRKTEFFYCGGKFYKATRARKYIVPPVEQCSAAEIFK